MQRSITFSWDDKDYDGDRSSIEYEQNILLNRYKYSAALADIENYIRHLNKHGIIRTRELTEKEMDLIELICEDLFDLIPELPE